MSKYVVSGPNSRGLSTLQYLTVPGVHAQQDKYSDNVYGRQCRGDVEVGPALDRTLFKVPRNRKLMSYNEVDKEIRPFFTFTPIPGSNGRLIRCEKTKEEFDIDSEVGKFVTKMMDESKKKKEREASLKKRFGRPQDDKAKARRRQLHRKRQKKEQEAQLESQVVGTWTPAQKARVVEEQKELDARVLPHIQTSYDAAFKRERASNKPSVAGAVYHVGREAMKDAFSRSKQVSPSTSDSAESEHTSGEKDKGTIQQKLKKKKKKNRYGPP